MPHSLSCYASFALLCSCWLSAAPSSPEQQAALTTAAPPPLQAPSSGMSEKVAEEMYVLAHTLLTDTAITDVSQVPRLLEGAAQAGFIPAQLLLLDVWEGKFRGLLAHHEKARALAQKIASEQLPASAPAEAHAAQIEAMRRLAHYHEHDHDEDEHTQQAFHWMQRAAQLGSARARAELARYYLKGIGCKRDPIAAIRLLKPLIKEAPQTPNLFFYLGFICQRGLGLKKPNYELAIKYYLHGIQCQDARAMNNLAILYERGIGIEQDEQQALRYYREAASLGDKSAAVNMQRLLRRLGSNAEQIEAPSYTERLRYALKHVMKYLPSPH